MKKIEPLKFIALILIVIGISTLNTDSFEFSSNYKSIISIILGVMLLLFKKKD